MDRLLSKVVDEAAGKVFGDDDDHDLHGAAAHAANQAPEDQDFFTDVLGSMLQNKRPAQIAEQDIDEEGR